MHIHGKDSVVAVRPILAVSELGEASTFYRRLGFSVESFDASYALVGSWGQ